MSFGPARRVRRWSYRRARVLYGGAPPGLERVLRRSVATPLGVTELGFVRCEPAAAGETP
jgi:hypothetical protein